ncbi:hypothetical protein J2X83_001809 [Brevibacillus nitrificans]|nr:hypothetical protein [Brevibacillus nitrificans]
MQRQTVKGLTTAAESGRLPGWEWPSVLGCTRSELERPYSLQRYAGVRAVEVQ